jgi:hypothetical protein
MIYRHSQDAAVAAAKCGFSRATGYRSSATPAARPERESSLFRKRRSSFPTVFATMRWKSCASITTPAVGPNASNNRRNQNR